KEAPMRRTFCLRVALAAVLIGSSNWSIAAAAGSRLPVASQTSLPVERLAEYSGSITIDSVTLDYTTKIGTLIVRKSDGEPDAELFYIAHTLNGADPHERPVTFIWNGGPGGATMLMDVIGFGPIR